MSLSELPRTDRLLWGIMLVAAALSALATWLLMPPEKTGGLLRQPSTFYNVGCGTKAAYMVLDRLDYPVARLRRPIVPETLDEIGGLFILRPFVGLQEYEMAQLEAWVRQGHALVVAPGSSTLDFLDDETPTGEKRENCDSSTCRASGGECFDAWFNTVAATADPNETSRMDAAAGRSNLGTELDANDPLCAGITRLTSGGNQRFARSPLGGPLANATPTIIWKDKLGPLALRVPLGDGVIIALAAPYPLTNQGIGEADNGLLLDNLARELLKFSSDAIAFDEYHLGFAERDWTPVAMTKLMLTGPWFWASAQLVLVGLLALCAGMARFGNPMDIKRKTRRRQQEFAEAAGRLMNEAGATSIAVESLHRHYRDRICRALRLEPRADDARLRQTVLDRAGPEIAAFLDQAQAAASQPMGRRELLAFTQKLHSVAETLDHGT